MYVLLISHIKAFVVANLTVNVLKLMSEFAAVPGIEDNLTPAKCESRLHHLVLAYITVTGN